MNFFLPKATDEIQAEEVYANIRKFVAGQVGQLTDRRIYSLPHRHNGVTHKAVVGEPFERLGETIIAILEGYIYYICTSTRGVVKGEPYLVGREEVISIEEFDAKTLKAST
jgi:hypothetical protein